MHFRPAVEWFESVLWRQASDDMRVYAVIDGHWAKGLYGRLLASPDLSWAHMFQGDVALRNIQKAPFIIALKRGHRLLRWLVEEGWGDGWGSYFLASTDAALKSYGPTRRLPPDMAPSNEEQVKLCSLTEGISDPLWLMRNHFRRFSDVEFEDDGRIVDFRYYDPATLRTYLMSCNERELRRFYGPVADFIFENYSEVPSLNRSQQVFVFRRIVEPLTSANNYRLKGSSHLETWLYDFTVGERLPFAPPPMSIGEGRGPGAHVMIRTEQIEAFKAVQFAAFVEGVVEDLSRLLKSLYPQTTGFNREAIKDLVVEQAELGRNYGLTSEKEIVAFCICAVIFGEGFDRKFPPIIDLLNQHSQTPLRDMADRLSEIIDAELGEGGSDYG